MGVLFVWIGAIGAWLLFAGPVYQAAVELRELGFDEEEQRVARERFQEMPRARPGFSPWWWLLPPVAYILAIRDHGAQRAELFKAIPAEQRARFITWQNKAAGWLIVGLGALLLAVKETAELIEAQEWPEWALAPMLVGPFLLSVGYTANRMARTRQFEHDAEDES